MGWLERRPSTQKSPLNSFLGSREFASIPPLFQRKKKKRISSPHSPHTHSGTSHWGMFLNYTHYLT